MAKRSYDDLLDVTDEAPEDPPAPDPVRGDKRLSRYKMSVLLDLANNTLDRYLTREGAPQPDKQGKYSLKEVTGWIAHIKSPTGTAMNSKDRIDQLRCRKMELDIKVIEGELIEADEIQPKLIVAIDELHKALRDNVEFELPQKVRGKTLAEITVECRAAVDRTLAAFKAKISKIAARDSIL